ncbi:MAG: prephenate dehydrogenase/arogenate dehydrogenase family protein [bacterium]|nr:prephenate dehydrogenase/arogenate dehydrogenase family protein [bacterium]
MREQKTVSIIGFGRFGQTLYRLIKDDFEEIIVYRRSGIRKREFSLGSHVKVARDVKEVFKSRFEGGFHTLFYCTPISTFGQVIKEHMKYFDDRHVIMDVLSVKKWPEEVLSKHLKDGRVQAILNHPMFGPDSSKDGFRGLPWVMDRFRSKDQAYRFWKSYFESKGLRVVELTAKEHDRLAAFSQGVAHFVGRLLAEFGMEPTVIDTVGARKLREVMEQTVNDSWQLFLDLQRFNPYTKQMRIKLGEAYDKLFHQLLPEQVKPGEVVFGIQGGRGSFNEEALMDYIRRHGVGSWGVKYLYTTERVLKALWEGEVDYGLFAIQNANGGVVEESITAMAKYKFRIKERFGIQIRHFLMKRPEVEASKIKAVMAHPQVFKQCRKNLSLKYPRLKQIAGRGELIDTAKAAEALAGGKIDADTAILGPKVLSDLYDLGIIEGNLQDSDDNVTDFLMVERLFR